MLKFVYITVSNKTEARKIASVLLEEHLAACVNIIDGVESMYWWDGKIQNDKEVIIIAKTTRTKVPTLITAVEEIHSYDVPCVEILSVENSSQEFSRWVEEETR